MSESAASVCGWRGAASGVVDRLRHLLDTGERSDIQFSVGSLYGKQQLFRAHRLVLSVGSDVFHAMFHGGIPETTDKIRLIDILPHAFAIMLKYLYTDIVEDLNMENVVPTLYCAKKYGIPKLIDFCADYAVNSVDKSSCLTMLEAAKVLDAEKLHSRCLNIVDEHFSEVAHSEEFLQLKQHTLREILDRDTLVADEEEVYQAAMRWATHACRFRRVEPTGTNCRVVLEDAFYAVRFSLMDDVQLANGPLATTGLLLNEEVLKIYQFKYAAKKPDIPFSSAPRSSDIAFCDRRWKILGQPDIGLEGIFKISANNAFLDEQGHLHLRFSRCNGVWKGACVRLCDALGFGRYECSIEGLNRLDENVGFSLYSQAENTPGVGILLFLEQNGGLVRFAVRHPHPVGPFDERTASSSKATRLYTHSRLFYHRKPDSVTFQQGYQINNAAGEVSSWSYDSRPNISQKALPVVICLTNITGSASSVAKEVEIVVRSFRFSPNE